MVDAGKLPPIEERLPTNPMVVTPHEDIGQYGGTWRMGLRGGGDTALLSRTLHYEPLARWTVLVEVGIVGGLHPDEFGPEDRHRPRGMYPQGHRRPPDTQHLDNYLPAIGKKHHNLLSPLP